MSLYAAKMVSTRSSKDCTILHSKKEMLPGIVASLFVDSQYLPYGSVSIALEQIAALHCEISESPELLMLCTCADDFVKAALEKKVGTFSPLKEQNRYLPASCYTHSYAAGVRGLGLTWSRRNMAADMAVILPEMQKKGRSD